MAGGLATGFFGMLAAVGILNGSLTGTLKGNQIFQILILNTYNTKIECS